MATAHANGTFDVLNSEVSNDAASTITYEMPYRVVVTIQGTSPLLFHRWSNEEVAAKATAAKGSKAKKSDNVEAFVYRTTEGFIALPGEYLRQAVVNAAKYRQDPRSPRKSAMDMYKAAIISLTPLAPITTAVGRAAEEWDALDKRRVTVQRAGITRQRPMFNEGWQATIEFMVNLPEYVRPADLHDVLVNAGRLIGVGDFRPTYGRFSVTHFAVVTD